MISKNKDIKNHTIDKQAYSFEHLSSSEYYVLRESGTESPFSSDLLEVHEGVFACKACGNILFSAEDKYNSGTGWPSFTKPITPDAISYRDDNKLGMKRTEVLCSQCKSHLGHVFDDGPKPTGTRFCMNGIALKSKLLSKNLQDK